jgi:tetratricopeptide (TPR) repeat protein
VPRRALTLALAIFTGACSGPTGDGGGSNAGGSAGGGGGGGPAEQLYQEGVTWARKAETAPLPTPDPSTHATPEFKAEELRAIESFEQAVATQADHAGAHLALGDLLAPHALRRIERERQARERQAQEAAARSRSRRGRTPPPTPTPAAVSGSLIDSSPERVIREYQAAALADPARTPVERLIAFSVAAGRLDAAEAGFQDLLVRLKESAEPHVLYGDFLVEHKKDAEAAIDQYRQALIWNPKDEPTRVKLAEVYLGRAADFYRAQEYMHAANELREAQKYVTDRNSDLGRRVQAMQVKMREIRR